MLQQILQFKTNTNLPISSSMKKLKPVERFLYLIKKAKNVVITTHVHPDADGIGSEIALCMALQEYGLNAVCVNEDTLMERYKYMDPDNVVTDYAKYAENELQVIDLFIVTDTNTLHRIGNNMQSLVARSKDLLFIDHHPCPKELMAIHCIDTKVAATGELVGGLITALGIKFNIKTALPLYTSILIDTSSFRYPTVTASTHALVAKLLETGIDPPHAYNMIYGTKKISYMKMLGRVLASAETTPDEKIAWLKLNEDELVEFDVDSEDTLGFINHLLILDHLEVAVMFREMGAQVKISLRSMGKVDVGIMAQALGGGGHDHSAATIVKGNIEEIIKETIEKIQLMLKN